MDGVWCKKKFCTFQIGIFLSLISESFSACQVASNGRDFEPTFIFSEVPENYPVGTKLPGSFYIESGELEFASLGQFDLKQEYSVEHHHTAKYYINATFNAESGCVDFYLMRSLKTYHLESWRPNLEYEFTLSCFKDKTPYTYMIAIKDDNLHQPNFTSSSFNGIIDYSTLEGFKINFDSEKERQCGIQVIDADFNLKHANLTITCEGTHCLFFDFSPVHKGFNKGHQFDVHIFLRKYELQTFNDTVANGDILRFSIFANDSKYSAKSDIALKVSLKNALGSLGKDPPFVFEAVIAIAVVAVIGTITTIYLQVRSWLKAKREKELEEFCIRDFIEGTSSYSDTTAVNIEITGVPYDKNFEIRRQDLKIDETTTLGTGAYGIVWKGTVGKKGKQTTVAVKTVKRKKCVGAPYFQAFLTEIKTMIYIGKHHNIVELIGACTSNIPKKVYIALEYCANGNFREFLECRLESFSNYVVDGELQLSHEPASLANSSVDTISTWDLLKWAAQIANGLQFLESKGVVHGDLALRNILLDHKMVAKIADFGLSRRLIEYSNYFEFAKDNKAYSFPWRWMSIESLKDLKFSHKSDIWSFGVLLWEMFNLGCEVPWVGWTWDNFFLDRLKKGDRLNKPVYTTNAIYELMYSCWNIDAKGRPDALDLKQSLEKMIESVLLQVEVSYMMFPVENACVAFLEDEEGYLRPKHLDEESSIQQVTSLTTSI